MKIAELQWDDKNYEHIALHKVKPPEVEDICFGSYISRKEASGRYVLCGQTAGGRYLNVVVEPIGKGVFRPITAFEISENYKRYYKKRLGK